MKDGIAIREDDHDDLVFAVSWFMRMKEERRLAAIQHERRKHVEKHVLKWYRRSGVIEAFDERFPGTNVASVSTHRTFILNLVTRAFWPTASLAVASDPCPTGGRPCETMYNKVRLQLSSGMYHSLIST